MEAALGRGAMGVVYRAHDPDIDRKVAIKLIRADLLSGEARENYLARFRREAQAAGRCTHPNIVTVYDFAVHEGNPFLAMEFVNGVSLAQFRGAAGRLAPADAVAIIGQVLEALAAAHAQGVVHRDIKPANILLVDGRLVKVTDFGISRLANSDMTQDGETIGTPSYMSPEQCRGEAATARSDLFSTACVLHELLSGGRAFGGANFMAVTRRVMEENPALLAELGVAVPQALQAALSRALAKAPEGRFGSAGEMHAALRAALADAGVASADNDIADNDITVVRPAGGGAGLGSAPGSGLGSGLGSLGGAGFDPALLDTLQRRLAQYLGPIAGHLVREAARAQTDAAALCASLAGNIGDAAARDAFVRDAAAQLALGSRGGGASGLGRVVAPEALGRVAAPEALGEAVLQQARAALAQHMGPIAGLLVKREAAGAASAAELWARLAGHIEEAGARAVFLRGAPKG